jgi:pilus assembly protein CpaE
VIAPVVRCLVVAADPALAGEMAALADDLPELQLVGAVAPLRAVSGRLPACDVVLVADPGSSMAPGLRQLVAGCARPAVVLSRAADVDAYRRALAAGARAVLPLPSAPSALADAVGEATAAAGPIPGGAPAGRVLAVAAATGGAGATAVALALARVAGATMVDLSGSRTAVAGLLGCGSERTLADLAHVGEGLAAALDTAAVEHPCGLRLVPGPPGPELAATLPGGFAAALVRELRGAAGAAVVDVGVAAFPAAREAAVAADRTVVVVTPDARAAAAARELVTALARWEASADAVGVVVNRWSRRAELSLRGIARSVGAPVVAALGTDRAAMAAFDNGRARLERWPPRAHAAALRRLAEELGG